MCGVKVTAANLPTRGKKWIVSCRVSGSDGLGGVSGEGGLCKGEAGAVPAKGADSRIPHG